MNLRERQETLSAHILAYKRRRREKFLYRAKHTRLKREALRAGYVSGCLLVDVLVIPQLALILLFPWGAILTLVLLIIEVYAQWRVYEAFFALPRGHTASRP